MENKYLTLCVLQNTFCVSGSIKIEGEEKAKKKKKKLSHLTYAVLPSHIVILLLETLGGSNCTKELN